MSRAWMTDEQKIFVITCLADYMPVAQIRRAFLDLYQRDISDALIGFYNPETETYGKPAKRWIQLFEHLRQTAHKRLRNVPVANPIYRLRMLQVIVQDNVHQDPDIAMAAMKQAAQEVGDLQERGIDVNLTANIVTGYLESELPSDEYEQLLRLLPSPGPRLLEASAPNAAPDQEAASVVGVEGARDLAS